MIFNEANGSFNALVGSFNAVNGPVISLNVPSASLNNKIIELKMSEPGAIATGFRVADEKNPVAIARGSDKKISARPNAKHFLCFRPF
jgi:hypothetical protein